MKLRQISKCSDIKWKKEAVVLLTLTDDWPNVALNDVFWWSGSRKPLLHQLSTVKQRLLQCFFSFSFCFKFTVCFYQISWKYIWCVNKKYMTNTISSITSGLVFILTFLYFRSNIYRVATIGSLKRIARKLINIEI